MGTIDWGKFAERVPAGTHVLSWDKEGILIENQPYHCSDHCIRIVHGFGDPSPLLRVQLFNGPRSELLSMRNPLMLLYRLNDKFVTFSEAMA